MSSAPTGASPAARARIGIPAALHRLVVRRLFRLLALVGGRRLGRALDRILEVLDALRQTLAQCRELRGREEQQGNDKNQQQVLRPKQIFKHAYVVSQRRAHPRPACPKERRPRPRPPPDTYPRIWSASSPAPAGSSPRWPRAPPPATRSPSGAPSPAREFRGSPAPPPGTRTCRAPPPRPRPVASRPSPAGMPCSRIPPSPCGRPVPSCPGCPAPPRRC